MSRTASILLSAMAGASAVLLTVTAPAAANPNAINPIPVLNGTSGLPQLVGRSRAVFQVTGMASPNTTQNYNILGTDLGIMWDNGNGEMLTAFGDTAGLGLPNLLAGSLWEWRSNILVRSHTQNPRNGIYFDSVVRDVFGQARDLIPSPKIPLLEISRIPTAGISVKGVQYMSLMSVKSWDQVGQWTTNYSGLAASADDGETWADLGFTRRPNEGGNANFQMNAFVKSDGWVFEYGTPSGRDNSAYVARVREDDIQNLGAYEYWDGGRWRKGDVNAAAPIAGGVGELSVMWNDYLGQFVMLTTDPWNSVVMRRSASPEGPWSPPEVLIDTRELPTAYAPSIFPYQTGRDLYFLTTVHSQYNVILMRTTL
ncbi:DUF4185 domain-containing protein [Nocardia terpenica]|uniref:Carbohydrate-binding domain protein n=2 Tax=Nocardia terpenica TaxID=455432 RepID=A0A164IR82_9NOCA|nr:carbohydrate-binding domain protein [Nocardia terpenica]MBF6062848.1 DUF4185 domain-containing protein [Nocardia terpenica]MBF6105017.1 DUF4185 domain-containing protein [Nocardia terpenica]MBF6112546.1 DUF4185 domain-containing protein [Nocardia terpenica]MBF6118745.1 DUF4185 domain-containing protein [Nocardia terpenica]